MVQRLDRQFQHALARFRTANEARSVNEDASLDAGELGQRFVANAAPRLRQRMTALEATRRCGNALNTPLSRRVLNEESTIKWICGGVER